MGIRLVVLTGPIGAGKSTVADLLARRTARAGLMTAVADLDDVAFMQHGRLDLGEFWRRAGVAHGQLVRAWFEAGVDVVVAHGPFFESDSYDAVFAAVPSGARTLHVLLHVGYEAALARVAGDGERRSDAISKDPNFLRSTHDAFEALRVMLPPVDVEVDTTDLAATAIADTLAEKVLAPDVGR